MRSRSFLTRRDALALISVACTAAVSNAQTTFPSRPVKVVVPQPPGGGWDTAARVLAEPFARVLGQSVIVENRTGAGTVVGTEYVAKAVPDGYTLLLGGMSNLAFNPGMYKTLGYDSMRDFEPVGLAVSYPHTLVARKSLPFTTLRQLVEYARANPKKLSYASAGLGSGQHVLGAALWQAAGVDVLHVPYRGSQPAYQDLIGERVDLIFDLTPITKPHVDAGYVKPLANSGNVRSTLQPDVPTLKETGISDLVYEGWIGIFAPAKVSAQVLERLRQDLGRVITSPEMVEMFRKGGGKPLNLSPAQARQLVQSDVSKWSQLVRDLAITAT